MDVTGHPPVPVASPPGKDPLLPTELEAGWAPQVAQTFRRNKKMSGPSQKSNPDRPAHSSVNIVNATPPPTLLLTKNECEANLFVSQYQIFTQSSDSMHQLVYSGKTKDRFCFSLPLSSNELYQQ
jgi:hypothetical protein